MNSDGCQSGDQQIVMQTRIIVGRRMSSRRTTNLTLSSILFDLDETLIDREATMRKFLIGQRQRLSNLIDCNDANYADVVLGFQNGGYADKRSAFQSALSELNQSLQHVDHVVKDFESLYGSEAIPFKGVRDTLLKLRDSYSLGLVSNGRSIGQRNKIQSANLNDLFDAISRLSLK